MKLFNEDFSKELNRESLDLGLGYIITKQRPVGNGWEDCEVFKQKTSEDFRIEKLAGLRQNLFDTDYKAIKYAEGLILPADYESVKQQRQTWRDEINNLQNSGV